MSVESNLKESFSDIHSVEANAKINFYSVKYNKRSKNENYAFSLPSEINESILKEICSNLTVYANQECKALNTTEKPTDAYEYVDLKTVYENWMEISSLITSPSPFNGKEANTKVSGANVGICHMRYLNNNYFLFLKQVSFQKAFQGKSVFMNSNNKLKEINVSDMIFLSTYVDFIIYPTSQDEGYVYVVNRNFFEEFFNFYDHIKKYVQNEIHIIDDWKFLESVELIKKKAGQKNVYKNLFKVFQDKEYIEQIKHVKASDLKERLISKGNGAFSEKDFNGNKLVITRSNLANVMKALAKGFKYNFITDRAEDI